MKNLLKSLGLFSLFFNTHSQMNGITECDIPYEDCSNEFVCPKITEVTTCGNDGLDDYATYRLSLVIKSPDVRNIYAIYGDSYSDDSQTSLSGPMILPPAYQSIENFNSNIGGVLPALVNIYPDSLFDSWLTVGITNGNINDEIMTIGIDFSSWDENNGLQVFNGAVFTSDPEENIVEGNEYTVAQITIPNTRHAQLILNAQGKTNCENHHNCYKDNLAWKQERIIFNINPPERRSIHDGCRVWYDGCNTCSISNGEIRGCTRMMCLT